VKLPSCFGPRHRDVDRTQIKAEAPADAHKKVVTEMGRVAPAGAGRCVGADAQVAMRGIHRVLAWTVAMVAKLATSAAVETGRVGPNRTP